MQVGEALSEKTIYQHAWRVINRLPEFIVDGGGQVIWGNAPFLRLAGEGEVFRIQGGCLIFIDRSAHAGFLTFLATLRAEPAAWVACSPAQDGYLVFRCVLVEPAERPPAIACTLYDSRDHEIPVWADFAGLFSLTVSEAQIARRLMEGVTLVRAAGQLGITTETAKTHLRRIYAKLGVGSREEFYARLLPFRVF